MGKAFNMFLAIATGGLSIPITKAIDDSNRKKENAANAAVTPLPLPQAPKPEDAVAKAEETVKRKRATQTQSIYSSPLGLAGEANVARKTLLGQ